MVLFRHRHSLGLTLAPRPVVVITADELLLLLLVGLSNAMTAIIHRHAHVRSITEASSAGHTATKVLLLQLLGQHLVLVFFH